MKSEDVDWNEIRQLLVRNWMTHDAIWFRHCAEACGIDITNRVNRAAVRSMAGIEIRRLMRAFGIAEVRTHDALRALIERAWELIGADFMDFRFSFDSPGALRVDVRGCFAFEGVSKLGLIDRYECGIFDRIEGWFEALGVRHRVSPEIRGCMMHERGRCHRLYEFEFDGDESS